MALRIRRTLAALVLAWGIVACAIPAAAKDVVIHAGVLIDGVSPVPRAKMSILIQGERIAAVREGFVTPADAEVIDLSDRTVLPGFVDCHDHISMAEDFSLPLEAFRSGPDDAIVNALRNGRRAIEQGFTSLRDLGSTRYEAPVLIKGEAAGVVIGPRIWTSLEPLGPTGGHSDPQNGVNGAIAFVDRERSIVDGADDARRKVREHHRDGAAVIKIMPSGGIASIGDDPHAIVMDDDEVRAVVDTAHRLHMKVAAHAHGKAAIDAVVAAGADSIEHGTYADAGSYRLMRQRGTYMVPTLLVADWIYRAATASPPKLSPPVAQKALAVAPVMMRNAGDAYRAGVKIALGTDISGLIRNKAEEFALLVKAGLPPMEAIFAGTRNAADLIGAPEDIGSVQAGRYADIVAVAGDPLADIAVLQSVDFVMKGGEVLKRGGDMLR